MEKTLKLYTYNKGGTDTPFPNEEQQIIIGSFTYTAQRMGGAPSISATVKHPLSLDNLWNENIYAEFNGEKYFVRNTPSSSKDNSDIRYEYDLELLSERYILNHVYFIDAVQGDSNTDQYKSNSTKIHFFGDLKEFVSRMNASFSYSRIQYYITIDDGISTDEKNVQFEDKYISEALQEAFSIYAIPYYFIGTSIHFGYTSNAISTPFKYGFDDALLSISKQNANYQVINRITGTGSTDNIPYYYPNSSPRGELGVKVLETSGYLKDSDFEVENGELFASKVKLTDLLVADGEGHWVIDDEPYSMSDLGLRYTRIVLIPAKGDVIVQTQESYITPSSNLMPPVYRNSGGADRFYNAKNNTYSDSDGNFYSFENEYVENNPLEGITKFEDIKPTISNVTNDTGQRIDSFIDFAYDLNDSDEMDENGEYLHPYFFAKLRKTDGEYGFNLFKQAIEQQAMQISFTSGVCGACTFEIGVDDDTQQNTVQVDDNGDLIRDENGNVRCGRAGLQKETPQVRQNDTRNYEVWIALKKDADTYPQIRPNAGYNYKPSVNDTFVILGINLPKGYILKAEQDLEDALIKYMWENNVEKFTFSCKFSRIYFNEHPDILYSLNENSRVIVEYGGRQHTFYIDEFTYKMESDSPLPDIEVNLVDTLNVGKNSLQTIIDGVTQDVLSSIGSTDFLKRGLKYFLRRDISDYTRYLLRLLGGLEVGQATDSLLAGRGIIADANGRIQADRVEIRGALVALELILNEIHALAGDYSFSDAGHIERVEMVDEAAGTYKLYIRKDTDADITTLDVDDVVYSIVNNLKAGGTDYYTCWMRVLTKNVNENSLTVSLYPGSEVPGGTNYLPLAGYNLTRRGNAQVPAGGEPQNGRAQSWLLSSREGRIMFLQNVYKPILEDYNYALTIGKLPNLKALDKLPVSTDDVGIVAQTIIAENFYQFDYNGDVVNRRVPRGEWSLETAQGTSPYRFVTHTSTQPDSSTVTLLEQHTVTHYGCTWACLIDKTQDEPAWNAPGWTMLEGDPNYYLAFNLPDEYTVRPGQVSIQLEAWVRYANRDITPALMAATGTEVEWLRDTGDIPADNAWSPQYVDRQKNVILIDNSDAHGVGLGFGSRYRQVSFTCRVFVPVGGQTQLVAEGKLQVI